ncbi:MAG TPA: hypothetical protein VFN78_07160 [Ktedonobacterales bacterium]|nr:hypothetical protein [Ktedonobacterales bacterium]
MGRTIHAPQPAAQRNVLALASLPLALVFPLGALCELVGSRIYHPVVAAMPLSSYFGSALVVAGLPAAALAIVAGHVALGRADRQLFWQPLRGIARIGIAFGYGSLLGMAGLVLWVVVHGIHVHYVF